MRQALIIALVLLFATNAHAHKVSIYGYVEAGQVRTESYFVDGTKCKACAVSALVNGKPLASGITDQEGMYSFALPKGALDIELKLDAGQGHGASYTVELDETAPARSMAQLELATLSDNEALRAIVREELTPLQREVQQLRIASERPGMTQIMGGIGYIIGLAGLAMWLKSRKG